MGLTSYKGEEVRKGDVTVAKNYLTQDEVSELNRVVNMWLDFAEDQARRRQQVFLRDWQDKLDQFLQFNDREVLQGAGKISKKMADEKAQAEYVQFAEQQRRFKRSRRREGYRWVCYSGIKSRKSSPESPQTPYAKPFGGTYGVTHLSSSKYKH